MALRRLAMIRLAMIRLAAGSSSRPASPEPWYQIAMRTTSLLLLCLLAACEAAPVPGTPCAASSDCRSPLVCRLARCRTECRENRDCANGARCLLDQDGLGACSVVSDERCGSGGTECPVSLTCVNDHCVNTCSGPSDCPADGECREAVGVGVSFCFAPDREDGGVPEDGGSVDAGDEVDASQSPDSGASDAGPRIAPLAIAVSEDTVCVVAADHRVVCWGNNMRGQLGDGTDDDTPQVHAGACTSGDCSLVPVEVRASGGALLRATDIAAVSGTFCAIAEPDAHAYCWGSCDEETCDESGPHIQARAILLTTITPTLTEIHGGRAYFCARASDGGVWCWGQAGYGQMGIGSFPSYYHGEAAAWRDTALAVGGSAMCALHGDGSVTCAGDNGGGALGPNGTVGTDEPSPITVPFTTSPSLVVAGAGFACALVGTMPLCWGESGVGKLGRPDPGDCVAGMACDPTPTPIGGSEAFTRLWAEGFTNVVCAARADGAVYCWGSREFGSAGPSTAGALPAHIAMFDGAVDIAMGIHTTCAVLASGVVRCMGGNEHGELQLPPDTVAHPTPVDVCVDATCS